MKQILLTLSVLSATASFAQKNKWSFSALTTFGIGGPQNSIVKTMNQQGFGETMQYNFLGLSGAIDYPKSERAGTYLAFATVRQKTNRSLFFVAGLSNQGTVSGFHYEGTDPILGFALGAFPRVKYRVVQCTGGYQYDIKHSWAKFGVGPSLFFFNYGLENPGSTSRKTSLVPGFSLNTRLPLGKQKRSFGLELVAEGNFAPKAKMKDLKEEYTSTPLKESKVNMVHAVVGLLLTLRG